VHDSVINKRIPLQEVVANVSSYTELLTAERLTKYMPSGPTRTNL